MRKKEKKAREKGKNRGSIGVKILSLLLGCIIITSIINLYITVPAMTREMSQQVKNNMNTLVEANGTIMENDMKELGGDLALSTDNLVQRLQYVKVGQIESSYAYVVAADGTMLFHPTRDKIGKPVENVAVKKILESIKSGIRPQTDTITYEFDGVKKYASFYVGKGLNYVLIITADENEALADVKATVRRSVLGALQTLAICSVVGALLTRNIIKPIKVITKKLNKLSKLDFTEDDLLTKTVKKSDETGEMARGVLQLTEKLREVMQEIKAESQELYTASNEMKYSATEITNAVTQMERAITEISDGATSQAAETQTATENVIIMGDMVGETNTEVDGFRSVAKEMSVAGDKATDILKNLSEINQQTKEAINEIYDQTVHTNESVIAIRKAIVMISEIADETNLLSLNASIEAARAGEAGRGFAVVASQIQKLADQSNASALQINNTISSLIAEFEKSMKTVDDVQEIIAKQDEDVQSTEEAFLEVREGIAKSLEGIGQIASKAEKLDKSRVKVVDIVQNLTAIAEENAASTEETSATAVEVTENMEGIAGGTKKMYDIATSLDEKVSQFIFEENETRIEE